LIKNRGETVCRVIGKRRNIGFTMWRLLYRSEWTRPNRAGKFGSGVSTGDAPLKISDFIRVN
jgi:hypothetical protein